MLLNCKGGADYLLNLLQPFQSNLSNLSNFYNKFLKVISGAKTEDEASTDTINLVNSLNTFGGLVSETIVSGKIISQTAADLDQGELLNDLCKTAATGALNLLEKMRAQNGEIDTNERPKLADTVEKIMRALTELLPKVHDISKEEIGDLIEQEMHNTSEAIEAAVAKLEVSKKIK